MLKRICATITTMATLWVAMAFIKPADHTNLVIKFDHFVGTSPLQLDNVNYKNEAGELFTVTKFKYYIGKMHLKKAGGGEVFFTDYYLVNEEEPESKTFTLGNIPPGKYTGISFLIGVDSADNCSGAQSGALDPSNAMFWAWNTGYIFLKLEGKCPSSKSPGHIFEYHIGGYKAPANCIRRISLDFSNALNASTNNGHELIIKADALEVLKAPNTIDFAKLSSVTDFHNATTIADNYTDMFSILSLK